VKKNNFLLLVLICIFVFGLLEMKVPPVAEVPYRNDDLALAKKAESLPEVEVGAGRSEVKPGHVLDVGAKADIVPRLYFSQDESVLIDESREDVEVVQWYEAEGFLNSLDDESFVLDVRNSHEFSAFIAEVGRITRGLEPALQQKFKDRVFVYIDQTSDLPPLPEDVTYEFELDD